MENKYGEAGPDKGGGLDHYKGGMRKKIIGGKKTKVYLQFKKTIANMSSKSRG